MPRVYNNFLRWHGRNKATRPKKPEFEKMTVWHLSEIRLSGSVSKHLKKGWTIDGAPYFETNETGIEYWYQKLVRKKL